MAHFLGEFECKLDVKNRLMIPAALKKLCRMLFEDRSKRMFNARKSDLHADAQKEKG